MRLFVAVRPPAQAAQELAAALGRPALQGDAKWHVTLAFLGERPDSAPLIPLLADVAGRHPAMTLSLRGGGTFGTRVLWAGLAGDVDALKALANDVRTALGAGNDRPFRPHLTVARGQLLVVPAGLTALAGQPWQATQLELVRSRLGRQAEHQVLAELALGVAQSAG